MTALDPATLNIPLALLEEMIRNAVSGSAPLPKAPRGRKPSKEYPRLELRTRRGARPIWYVYDEGGSEQSTNALEHQRAEAEAYFAAYKIVKAAARLGTVSPLSVSVSAICAHAIEGLGRRPDPVMGRPHGDPKAKASRNAIRRFDEKVRNLARINAYFGDTPMREITERSLRAYVAERLEQPLETLGPDTPEQRCVTEGTVRKELQTFRKAVQAFADDKEIHGLPWIWVPPNSAHRTRFLTRSECARLVGAALGFVWDKETGDWARQTVGSSGCRRRLVRRPPAIRGVRQAMLRFILIALYTGTRSTPLRELRWRLSRDAGAVDIESGMLHRQGLGVAPKRGKKQPAIDLPERLLRHLRRWRAMDDDMGTDFVIHKADGTPYWNRMQHLWDVVAEDAGFGDDPEVIPHCLRHTCATWLRLSRVRLEEAADYLGMDPVTLIKVYGQRTIDGHGAATAAMNDARSIRKLRVMSGAEHPRSSRAKTKQMPMAKPTSSRPVWLIPSGVQEVVLPPRAVLNGRPGRVLARLAA